MMSQGQYWAELRSACQRILLGLQCYLFRFRRCLGPSFLSSNLLMNRLLTAKMNPCSKGPAGKFSKLLVRERAHSVCRRSFCTNSDKNRWKMYCVRPWVLKSAFLRVCGSSN